MDTKKLSIVAVILLFLSLSTIPSTSTTVIEKSSLPIGQDKSFISINDVSDYTQISDVVNSLEKSICGHVAYAWVAASKKYAEGSCYFDVTNPGTIIKLTDYLGPGFLSGGTWTNDHRWLCCWYNDGALEEVDPLTGGMNHIGGGGVGLNGLACNPVDNKLYGAGETALYLVNPETGDQELIGSYGSGVQYIIDIAFDSMGTLYGWDIVQDKLWTIDTGLGIATEVGPLGIDLHYAQDGDFDKDNGDILYLAAFTLNPNYGGYLYTCDKETGACTLVGEFPGITDLDAMAIPYNWSNPIADFTWEPDHPDSNESILFNASNSYDPDGDIILYEWDWDNDGVFDENHTSPTTTHTYEEAGYYPVTLKIMDNENLTDSKTKTVRVGNRPPRAPIIDGPTHGKVGVEYQYNFSLLDPDDDRMYLRVDWGNGTSGPWQGLYSSNKTIKLSHTWNQKGTYTIKAQAKDIYGMESDWGTLKVTMLKSKDVNLNTLNLMEKFPLLERFFLFTNQHIKIKPSIYYFKLK